MKKNLNKILNYDNLKRCFDLVFSLIFVLILFPLFLFISISIYFFDKGPIFFKQSRIGKDGKIFTIYKFRTMQIKESALNQEIVNAEIVENKFEARKRYKTTLQNDPRISKIGRILRPIHLDELPQLINVLFGDMSIVGPRPDAPVQESDYTELFWKKRISIKPGITGYAQLYDCPKLSDRNFYDESYIKKRNFRFDLVIIFRTFLKLIILKSI